MELAEYQCKLLSGSLQCRQSKELYVMLRKEPNCTICYTRRPKGKSQFSNYLSLFQYVLIFQFFCNTNLNNELISLLIKFGVSLLTLTKKSGNYPLTLLEGRSLNSSQYLVFAIQHKLPKRINIHLYRKCKVIRRTRFQEARHTQQRALQLFVMTRSKASV